MSEAGTGPGFAPELVGARVIAVIARMQKIPADLIALDQSFEDLKIDSLDGINLMFEVENEFGIEIPDEEAKQIRSVRQMTEGIEKLLAAKGA